jgi:hypothetical protein
MQPLRSLRRGLTILQSQSDEQMLSSIEFGEARSQMHAWRGRLTEQELREVMVYVRRLGST